MRSRILVVAEGEAEIDTAVRTLKRRDCEVLRASGYSDLVGQVVDDRADVAVVCISVPFAGDTSVCRKIREVSGIPVAVFADRADEDSEVAALHAGVDMFISAPVSARLFAARIRTLSKRKWGRQLEQRIDIFQAGDLHVDMVRQEAILSGKRLSLSGTEARVLVALASGGGGVVGQDDLLAMVWGSEHLGEPTYYARLKLHISALRKKIEANPGRPSYIITRRGRGYCLRGVISGRQASGSWTAHGLMPRPTNFIAG